MGVVPIIVVALLAYMILSLFGVRISDWPFIFLVAAVIVAVKWKTIAQTFDYLFTKYPAQPIAPTPGGPAPTFHHQNEAQAARAIKGKLDADTEIAEATMQLERARMLLGEAEREAEEERERSPGASV